MTKVAEYGRWSIWKLNKNKFKVIHEQGGNIEFITEDMANLERDALNIISMYEESEWPFNA